MGFSHPTDLSGRSSPSDYLLLPRDHVSSRPTLRDRHYSVGYPRGARRYREESERKSHGTGSHRIANHQTYPCEEDLFSIYGGFHWCLLQRQYHQIGHRSFRFTLKHWCLLHHYHQRYASSVVCYHRHHAGRFVQFPAI